MSAARVFVARLAGCSVFDPAGDKVGRVRDVLVVYRKAQAPRVVGFIVEVPGRRHVFLSIGRVTSIGSGQTITTGLINLRRFEQRGGEVRVIAEMLGRKVALVDGSGTATIEDVAIEESGPGDWQVSDLFLRRPKVGSSPFAKGQTLFAGWSAVKEKTAAGEAQSAAQLVATYEDLLPADLANALLDLPEQRMLEVAEELSDARLADVLEEMPESEQVRILNQLEDDRAADVLDQMQPDDAADLIAQLSEERGEALLTLMQPEEAEDVRMLLLYAPDTAGGLMTTEPIIVSADATVAEGLALIRRHETAPALGAAVCVTLPPYEPPTGRFLGMVHFQRMLRYPPNERLGTLLDLKLDPVQADASAAEVARILATYDLVSVPVVDQNHRLVGVVTIDDVLDYLLPDDWRSHDEDDPAKPISADTRPQPIITPAGRGTSMARRADPGLDSPKGLRTSFVPFLGGRKDRMGRFSESFARAMGTPWFLAGMTIFCAAWLAYNTWAPESAQFDPRVQNYTLLTLILSLQASYAAPMILLAQNRQDDRDRVQIEQDRQRAERNLNDTEYLAREVVALRLAMKDVASKDFIRAELRALLEELDRDKDPDRIE